MKILTLYFKNFIKLFLINSTNTYTISFYWLKCLLNLFLPKYNIINSLIYLFSSLITLHLLIINYTKLAIIFYCLIWFLNIQLSTQDKIQLIENIINDNKKRKIYQKEIIKIVQSRYLLANDYLKDYEWINFLFKTKWIKFIHKKFQNELNLILFSNYIDNKFLLKDDFNLFFNWSNQNDLIIEKNTYRIDSLILKESKLPYLHEIIKLKSIRKNEIAFQIKIQFWIDIILNDPIKDEKKIIKDLEFLGYARLILLPILNRKPFFGGFIFNFNRKLVLLSNRNFSEFNQSNLLEEFIKKKVNQILFNPVYKINGCFFNKNLFKKYIFNAPILLCYINLIEIVNLDNPNLTGCFYYCLIKLGENIHQTKIIKNSVTPKFNEIITLPIYDIYESIKIKIFFKKNENDKPICIGKLKINLPNDNLSNLTNYLNNIYKLFPVFSGKSFWLPFKIKNQSNRLPFINLKIALFNLNDNYDQLIDRSLTQLNKNPNLPCFILNVSLTNIQLDYLINEYPLINKLGKDQIVRIKANFNGNYQFGRHFFIESNQKSIISKIKEVKFFFIENSFNASNELSFELELYKLNDHRENLPGNLKIKLNDLILSKKNNIRKLITFQLHKLNKINPIIIGTSELYLTIQTVLIKNSDLENLTDKIDVQFEHSKPQNLNLISYISSYSEKTNAEKDKAFDEFAPDLELKKIITKDQSKSSLNRQDNKKENDCEILIVFHYPSKQLLLVDIIRLINVPKISNELPSPQLLIEMWKDKTRVAYSKTEKKYQTTDPFYSIQVQFEISSNKLSNLFLRILILEHAKKSIIAKDNPQFVAEAFIKIPELEVGSQSKPQWYKFSTIGIFD